MTHPNPVNDILLRLGVKDSVQVDLKAAFGDAYTTFSITSSDGKAIAHAIDDNGILTISTTGELGFSDFVLTATDAGGNTVTDNFRALAAGPNAFTVAALPDTHYTSIPALHHIFGDITQWLANNAESLGIQFVIGLGDVTDNNRAAEWEIASAALHRLDGIIPYSILPGNHDQALNGSAANHTTDFLDTLFSPEIQAAINPDTFGGVYDREPDRSANTFHTFSAPDGTNWLVLSLEFGPRDDVLRWAGDVIEGHLDHRVIIASHSLTNESQRQDAFGLNRPNNYTPQRYGVGNSPEGMNDGEDVYRELLSKYPNIVFTLSGHEIGEDGAHTLTSYSQHGNKFLEMLANYQRGGVHADMRPDNGQIRLLTIDPDNGAIYTSTYMTEDDEYLDGYRGSRELSRDGLTGPYRHHQETITGLDLGPVKLYAQANAGRDLFIDAPADATSATVRLDGAGTLNPALAGSWEWLDENGQIVATGAQADIVLTEGKHRLTLAVTDENGRVTTDEKLVVVSGANTLLVENFNDGNADGWQVAGASTPGIGTWQLQGTAFAPDTEPGTGEAALYDRTNGASNLLIWGDESAKDWIDYSFDVTMISTDNDHIGVVFYYQDLQNYYQFYMDDQNTSRFLVKVEDGVRNVLAVSRQGYRFNDELDVHVAVSGNEINVLLDGKNVFGNGPVVVANPLESGGTIGVFSSGQRSSTFDDIVVNKLSLTAHADADTRAIAEPGRDTALVNLTAASSYGPDAIVEYKWLVGDEVVATTREAAVQLAVGARNVRLEVTDSTGKVSTDSVNVDVFGHADVLARDDFNRTSIGNDWFILDEGTLSGPSRWEIRDGRLWEPSNIHGQQLTSGGGNQSTGNWALGWSPLGDGHFILRKGTIAVYDPAEVSTRDWKDYSLSVNFRTNDNDGLGLVFYYQDPDNYYKIELDEENGHWTLSRLHEGIEQVLGQAYGGYVIGKETDLRVDIVDHKIMVYVDGEKLFPYPIEDRELKGGTFGLYDWGSDSLSFDDVLVVSLARTDPEEPVDDVPTAEYSGNVWLLEGDAVTTKTGQFKFDGGANNGVVTELSWGPKGGAYDVGNGTTVVPLSSNGLPVTVSHEDQGPLTLIGRDSEGNEVFRVSATPAGEYTVSLSGALDHPDAGLAGAEDALRARVNFTVTDDDGDTASGHIQFDVRDGAPTAAYSGNTWLKEGDAVTTKTGQFKFDGGPDGAVITALSWGPKGGAYDVGNGTKVVPLTSNGLPVTVSHEDQGPLTLIGRDSEGTEIFRISSTETGQYTVALSGHLDHPADSGVGKDDALRARINFTATDADGDTASGHIQFDIRNGDEVSPYEIVPNAFGGHDIFLHVADALVPGLGTDSLDRVFYDGGKADVVLPDTIEQGTLLAPANDSNLFGNALDNVLTGNDFANIIKGGAGRDVMTGGKGADIFLFDAADQSGIRQIDHVTDFSSSDGDKVVFHDMGVQQQANKSFLFSSVFRDGMLNNSLSNVLSLLTDDAALATTAVAALMSENSVAGFRFDGDWYVVQTGDRSANAGGIRDPLSLFSQGGLKKILDMAADHLAVENVVEIDLVGANTIARLDSVVSYDLVA